MERVRKVVSDMDPASKVALGFFVIMLSIGGFFGSIFWFVNALMDGPKEKARKPGRSDRS